MSDNENNKITIPSIAVFPDQITSQEEKPEVNILGRPIKYRPIFKKKTLEYVQKCRDEWERVVKNESEKGTQFEIKNKVELPTMAGLALYLGVTKTSLYKWKKEYPDFSYSLSSLLAEQEKRLTNNGLGGQYDPKLTALLLGVNHGVRPPVITVPDVIEVGPTNLVQIMNFTQQNITNVKESEKLPKKEDK